MKTTYIISIIFFAFIFSYCAKEKEQNKNIQAPKLFNGIWTSEKNIVGNQLFELRLYRNRNKIQGHYCAVVETSKGQIIDCSNDSIQISSIDGSIRNQQFLATFKNSITGEFGKVRIKFDNDLIRWKIIEKPGKEFLKDFACPKNATLKKSNQSEIAIIEEGKEFQWKTALNGKYSTFMNGKWILTDFFDSTLINKSLIKYFDQPAANFAVVLDFKNLENDSIQLKGILDQETYFAEKINPFKLSVDDYLMNAQFRYDPKSDLIKHSVLSKGTGKATVNFYRHVSGFDYDIPSEEMEIYFNAILHGQYRVLHSKNKENNNTIVFNEDNHVTGIKGFHYYNLCWGNKPNQPEDFDAVLFKRRKNSRTNTYMHWKMNGDTLKFFETNKKGSHIGENLFTLIREN